jgi:hypothetical protein
MPDAKPDKQPDKHEPKADVKAEPKAASKTKPDVKLLDYKGTKDAKANAKAPEKPESAQQLLALSEIGIWIDTYDDIFSDFDPRPYSQRALSVDFLDEAKRAAREKNGQPVIHFLAPTAIRNTQSESTIKKRLKEHFKRHADLKAAEERAMNNQAYLMIAIGSVILVLATVVSFYVPEMIWKDFLVVLLEPAGWFTVWTGFDKRFFKSNDFIEETRFYTRMQNAEIKFDSY